MHKNFRSPTYAFIVNQSIADLLSLLSIGFYAGLMIMLDQAQSGLVTVDKTMTSFLQLGWYCSGYFTILISMSRLIAIKFTGLHRKICLKHANFVSFLVWLVVLCLACYTAFYDTRKAYGIILPRLFTLGIDLWDDYSQFLSYYNFCHNVTCCLVVIVINTVTYFYVKSSRNRVVSLQQSQVNKLEIKLYFQCVTVSAILTVLCIIYGVVFFLGWTLGKLKFLVFHIFWISYHAFGAIFYLTTNRELREICVKWAKKMFYCLK